MLRPSPAGAPTAAPVVVRTPGRRAAPAAAVLALLLATACSPGLEPITRPRPAARPAPAHDVPAAALSDAEYLRARQLMVPVAGVAPARIPDSFTADRGDHVHHALDILAPRGTPVLAADDGRVLRVSSNRLGGLTIYLLDAAERFVYYYAHLDRYRDGLHAGMPVARGEVLGYVGTTGNAPENVPHLHFQAMRYRRDRYWDGEPVNPKPYLALPGAEVQAVSAGEQRREREPE
ncbi:MAG TPA: M23 family metallopeptidase [Gemmatimonadaceae bacterium]|nr:M23 family metallopeptidase [Gemmatimonadaceae bacterium]